jgi:hypothetical protein
LLHYIIPNEYSIKYGSPLFVWFLWRFAGRCRGTLASLARLALCLGHCSNLTEPMMVFWYVFLSVFFATLHYTKWIFDKIHVIPPEYFIKWTFYFIIISVNVVIANKYSMKWKLCQSVLYKVITFLNVVRISKMISNVVMPNKGEPCRIAHSRQI